MDKDSRHLADFDKGDEVKDFLKKHRRGIYLFLIFLI